jgi:glycosyltransferase involved in cell wall biosynthesis
MTATTTTTTTTSTDSVAPHHYSKKNVIVITYEFTYSPFSGNGILARSLVKSFLGLGCCVTVWCCRPSSQDDDDDDNNNNNVDNHLQPPEISADSAQRLTVLSNIVHGPWKCLDDISCWKEFCFSHTEDQHSLQKAISAADVAYVIDWTGSLAYHSVLNCDNVQHINECDQLSSPSPSFFVVYMNFRVFSLGMTDPIRQEWFDSMELQAIQHANVIVALSQKDAEYLVFLLQKQQQKIQQRPLPIEVVLPPLRQDIEDLARKSTPGDLIDSLPTPVRSVIKKEESRSLVVCVARQSPEKCIKRFVKFVEMTKTLLQNLNLTVVLAGAASDIEYATSVKQRLLQAYPSAVIIERFLSPLELSAVFAQSILNFHPSAYDAYGMTIVEAAAFGTPSVLAGPSVGAFSLLKDDGCVQVDMPSQNEDDFPTSSLDTVLDFLVQSRKMDTAIFESVSTSARQRALEWGEQAYGKTLLEIVDRYNK